MKIFIVSNCSTCPYDNKLTHTESSYASTCIKDNNKLIVNYPLPNDSCPLGDTQDDDLIKYILDNRE